MSNIFARYDQLNREANDLVTERNLVRQRLANLEAAIIKNERDLSDLLLEAEETALRSRLGF